MCVAISSLLKTIPTNVICNIRLLSFQLSIVACKLRASRSEDTLPKNNRLLSIRTAANDVNHSVDVTYPGFRLTASWAKKSNVGEKVGFPEDCLCKVLYHRYCRLCCGQGSACEKRLVAIQKKEDEEEASIIDIELSQNLCLCDVVFGDGSRCFCGFRTETEKPENRGSPESKEEGDRNRKPANPPDDAQPPKRYRAAARNASKSSSKTPSKKAHQSAKEKPDEMQINRQTLTMKTPEYDVPIDGNGNELPVQNRSPVATPDPGNPLETRTGIHDIYSPELLHQSPAHHDVPAAPDINGEAAAEDKPEQLKQTELYAVQVRTRETQERNNPEL
ncbi:hypothetical protein R1sor_024462 [Riccia sorocarpa]|uniref:Uncharacterized protein n=1 Tax=Riccia sorocarpa TaxID=122646 RepID=A0ABD3GUN1_9MARC